VLKETHSRLRKCFSNAVIGKKSANKKPHSWLREV